MKKLVTLLMALAMVLTLGTAAMAADMGTGTEADPYVYYGAPETTDVVPAGGSIHCQIYRVAGMVLTINDADAYVVFNGVTYEAVDGVVSVLLTVDMPMAPVSLVIGNKGAEDKSFACSFTLPAGEMSNPVVLEGEFLYETVALAEGDGDGYFYQWTAVASGTLELQLYSVTGAEGVEADIVVTNQNTGAQRSLSADGAVDEYGTTVLKLEVTEGDVLSINVCVAPDANWNIPAAEVSWGGAFSYPLGSEFNPIMLEPEWNAEQTEASLTFTAPAGTTYFGIYAGGMTMILDGGEPVQIPMSMGRMPYVFCITAEAEGEHTITLSYPVGSMSNPAVVENGSHTVSFAEGAQPYYMTWIAEADGEIVISVESTTGWFYVVNNMTSWAYGDNHYSDDDPAVSSETIAVAAGDELQIIFNPYDPANPWSAPAGDVTISINYAGSDDTGDMIGVVVAMLAVSGMGITVLKKKEF